MAAAAAVELPRKLTQLLRARNENWSKRVPVIIHHENRKDEDHEIVVF